MLIRGISPRIFFADSPEINPALIANLRALPETIQSLPQKLLAKLNPFNLLHRPDSIDSWTPVYVANVENITPVPGLLYKTIIKGVRAAVNPETGQKIIEVEAGTKYQITGYTTINGVKVPKIEFVE